MRSLTHCTPFGEKMENPDDEPARTWSANSPRPISHRIYIPIYLVSPWVFVTREHIISDKASTLSLGSFRGGCIEFRRLCSCSVA